MRNNYIETVMGWHGSKDNGSDVDCEEEPTSDLDFGAYEDDSGHSEDIEDGDEAFMDSYSDALHQELNATTPNKTFVHAKEQFTRKKDEGASGVSDDMELTPVDVSLKSDQLRGNYVLL